MEQRKRRRLSAEAWRALLARFSESGLTVSAFCEREAISAASFYQWRVKLEGTGTVSSQPPLLTEGPTRSAGFVDLGTLSARTSRFEVRLELGEGVLLHLVRG